MAWMDDIRAWGELREHESMARHVTLGVGGAARWFFRPASCEGLCAALPLLPIDLPLLPLGRGSNLLVADSGFDGIVIDLGALDHLRVDGRTLHCEAGARMSAVAACSVDAGLAGVEFMATVPGNIGGAVAMNAGAFGQQVSDTLETATVALRDGSLRTLPAAELRMAYRCCRLPEDALVVEAAFALRPADAADVRARIREMRVRRGASQPLSQPNCGSVFRNPEGDHAARLIEAVDLKGARVGAAQISPLHANFIVNLGGAGSADVLALMRMAQERVAERFGVRLEPELRVVGA